MTATLNRPLVGLALGGGAFRGMAHVGVLEVLREEDIPVDFVAGTSMGALVGAAFCAGSDMHMLEKLGGTLDDRALWDLAVPRQGLLHGKKVQELVMTLTHNASFEELSIPFTAVACDLSTGEQVLLRSGKLHEAVRASIAIPGVFEPFLLGDRMLSDGGLVNRVPDDVAREMGADVVIAVDVSFRGRHSPVTGIAQIMMRAFDIAQYESMRWKKRTANLFLIPDVADMDAITLADSDNAVAAGRACALAALPSLRNILDIAQKKLDKKGRIKKLPQVQVEGARMEEARPPQ